jgi:DNA repair protein RecO (recombination protein O)
VSILRSEALVVRTVDFGESDVIATFVTEQVGKIGAVVRGARKGSRRVGGALEPVHTIAVLLDDKRGAELATLKEARIVRLRAGVAASLDALEVAGVALRWARHLFPPRTPEPAGWRVLVDLLDVLDSGTSSPRKELARAGLAMLAAVGYALDLERCVACGRPCPAGKAACIDPARGGLICRACGGAGSVLLPEARDAARSLVRGEPVEITDRQADELLAVVDRAMAAHTGFER